MAHHVDIKKEPPWYGETPDNGERREPTTSELRGIDQISQSSYSAAVNLLHGPDVKRESPVDASRPPPDSVVMDVDFDRIIPQFVCAPDVDPFQNVVVSGGPNVKQETTEDSGPQRTSPGVGGSTVPSDHGTSLSSPPGTFVFCPVIGLPSTLECCKSEPNESVAENNSLEFVESSSEVASSRFPSLAEPSRANETAELCGSRSKRKHKQVKIRVDDRGDADKRVGIDVSVERSADVRAKPLTLIKVFAKTKVAQSENNLSDKSPIDDPCAKPMTLIKVSTPRVAPNDTNVVVDPPANEPHTKAPSTTKVAATSKIKPFACDLCEVRFTTFSHMKTHQKIHTGERHFACDECNARFVKKSCLVRHERTHTGDRPYGCDKCPAQFSQKSSLSTHERIHAGVKQYACDLCEARFTQSSTLKSHRRVHTGVKPYACDRCDKRFTRGSDLKTHRRRHTGETPYACATCGVRFTLKANLVKHARTHTGERPYACTFCDARFTQLGNLAKHRQIHTRDTPYGCGFCEAAFASLYSLKAHKKVHLGPRPYVCAVCEERYSERDHLDAHKLQHHP